MIIGLLITALFFETLVIIGLWRANKKLLLSLSYAAAQHVVHEELHADLKKELRALFAIAQGKQNPN